MALNEQNYHHDPEGQGIVAIQDLDWGLVRKFSGHVITTKTYEEAGLKWRKVRYSTTIGKYSRNCTLIYLSSDGDSRAFQSLRVRDELEIYRSISACLPSSDGQIDFPVAAIYATGKVLYMSPSTIRAQFT